MDSLIMEIVICRSPTGHRYISNNNASCFIFLWLALWILPGMKDCQSKVRVPTVRTRSWSSSSTWSPNGGLSCKQHQSVCSHRTKPSTELIMKKKKSLHNLSITSSSSWSHVSVTRCPAPPCREAPVSHSGFSSISQKHSLVWFPSR